MTMRATAIIGAAAAATVAAAAAFAAHSADSSAILGALNAERAANGIPADVRENLAWSAKCADHIAYMAAARKLTHVEDPESPRYTESGDWAGRNSVLALGSEPGATLPFASAPLHLVQLLSPALREVGIADDPSGYLCITTWPGYRTNRSPEPVVYTYPGDGAENVPFAEKVSEEPFAPGDAVGLPHGKPTGFYLMVFAAGAAAPMRAHIVSAALFGPAGAVAVKTVDRTTPKVGVYLPPGAGFLIPVSPLRPATTYRATVSFAGGLRRAWRFTTAPVG